MTTATTMIAAGSGRVCRREAALLFDVAGENADLVASFSAAASDRTAVSSVKQHLIASEFKGSPVLVLTWTADAVEVILFGDIELHSSSPAAPMISGVGSATWIERRFGSFELSGATQADFWCGPEADTATDLRLGTTLAGGFQLALSGIEASDPAEPALDATTEAATPVQGELPEQAESTQEEAASRADEAVAIAQPAADVAPPVPATPTAATPTAVASAGVEPTPEAAPAPPPPVADLAPPPPPSSAAAEPVVPEVAEPAQAIDWSDTQDQSAIQSPEPAESPGSDPFRSPPRSAPLPPPPSAPQAAQAPLPPPAPPAPPTAPIADVAPPPPATSPLPPPPPLPTAVGADLPPPVIVPSSPPPSFTDDPPTDPGVIPAVGEGSDAPPIGLVEAAMCDKGHPNPPQVATCHSCSATVGQDAPRALVEQPVVGQLVFADGQIVPIDRRIVMGRKPIVDEGQAIAVTLDQPEVSRIHAFITVEGWSVLLTDNDSRNGTYVMSSEEMAPARLQGGVQHFLEDGTTVHLGAPEASFRFEVVRNDAAALAGT